MQEQTFFDSDRQIVVRLTDDCLYYVPADAKGWQARLDDVGFTTSVITSRGIQEVHLHGHTGRIATTLLRFENIERFYLNLLQTLARRPILDPVRTQLPQQVALLERVLWLATESTEADGQWEDLQVAGKSVAVATTNGLLIYPDGYPHVERIAWRDLAGVRCRSASRYVPAEVVRFYSRDSHVELTFTQPTQAFDDFCSRCRTRVEAGLALDGPAFSIPGVRCADEDLAMDYSWEIEAARNDGLLTADETVVACAFGGIIAGPAPTAVAERGGFFGTVGAVLPNGSGGEEPEPTRTDILLTTRQLLRVERKVSTGALVQKHQLPIDRIPPIRRRGAELFIAGTDLETDSAQPFDIAAEFWRRYRRVVAERLDPFAPEEEPFIPVLAARRGPDPFAVEA
jgi:hypothetical protein